MKTTITIADDSAAAPQAEAPQAELQVTDAGPAPVDPSTPSADRGSHGGGGEDGGAAPEWLRELIEATGPAPATGDPEDAEDAGAAPTSFPT
jgi:hypothetical protein